MLNRTLFAAILLSTAALAASAQIKPVLPSDAGRARARRKPRRYLTPRPRN
jgi:hypothetical protein